MSRTVGIKAVWVWLAAPVAFGLGVAIGVGLLGGRFLLYGNPDPLNDGWPLYLQTASFSGGLAVTLLSRRPVASATGLYSGLVGYMLMTRTCEYPMASAIALAVHGLLPATCGAVLCTILITFTRTDP